MLLMNERKAYNGPVFSEGGNHWWYAGLADGNYANDDLEQLPVFPDFHLLKIHPLEIDAGNRGKEHAYLAYTLAYGNIGILSEGLDAVRRYAMLQPVQDEYVMRKVRSIEYADENGTLLNSSQAAIKKLFTKPRLKVVYETGFEIFVNFSEQNWKLDVDSGTITLPQYGFYVRKPRSDLVSSSVLSAQSGKRLDMVKSKDLYYVNTHGAKISGDLAGKGEYILKKEKFGWEIIPLADDSEIDIDMSLLSITGKNISFEQLDADGKRIGSVDNTSGSRIILSPEKQVEKYRIIPKVD